MPTENIAGLDPAALNPARISRDPRFDGKFRSWAATLHALARAVIERRIDFSAAPEEVVAVGT